MNFIQLTMANANKPSELTAEWTVHAQLTISHPNDLRKRSFDNGTDGDRSNADGKTPATKTGDDSKLLEDDCNNNDSQNSNPFKVVYKFSSDDVTDNSNNNNDNDSAKFQKGNIIFSSSEPLRDKVIHSPCSFTIYSKIHLLLILPHIIFKEYKWRKWCCNW